MSSMGLNYPAHGIFSIHRNLYPQMPNSAPSVPFTSSPVVNAELTPTIELLTRDFINTWLDYVALDPSIGQEIQSVIKQICQRIERRLRKVDWVELLLCDLPDLIRYHIQTYRDCKLQSRNAHQSAGLTAAELYRLRRPHVAVISDQYQHQYLLSFSRRLCEQLLPPKERQSKIIRSFVEELVMGMLAIAVNRLMDSDFVYDCILTILISSDSQMAQDSALRIQRRPGKRRTPQQKERRDLLIVSGANSGPSLPAIRSSCTRDVSEASSHIPPQQKSSLTAAVKSAASAAAASSMPLLAGTEQSQPFPPLPPRRHSSRPPNTDTNTTASINAGLTDSSKPSLESIINQESSRQFFNTRWRRNRSNSEQSARASNYNDNTNSRSVSPSSAAQPVPVKTGGTNNNNNKQRLFSTLKRPSVNFQPLSLASSRKHSAILLLTPDESASTAATFRSSPVADVNVRLSEPLNVPAYATIPRGINRNSSAVALGGPQNATTTSSNNLRLPPEGSLLSSPESDLRGYQGSKPPLRHRKASSHPPPLTVPSFSSTRRPPVDGNESDQEDSDEENDVNCNLSDRSVEEEGGEFYWPSLLRLDTWAGIWERTGNCIRSTVSRLRSPMPAQLGPIDCHKYRDHLLDEDWLRCVEAMFDLRQQQNYWLWMAFLYLLRPLVWVLCGGWLRQFILQDLLFDGLLSEHRVAVYVRSAREVLWPAGVWADAAPQKTDDQRRLTRLALEAEMKKLLTPGFGTAMGEPVVDDGIAVLLDSLSDPAVNRHVIFNLLDLIAYRLHLTQLI